jgi:hypothetical protein
VVPTQCMYRHPYPVGYRASKTYRGHVFTMEILEGGPHAGPIFRVRVRARMYVFMCECVCVCVLAARLSPDGAPRGS